MVLDEKIQPIDQALQSPSYKWVNRSAESGTTVPLTTSEQVKYIKFPANDVLNLARSYLEWDNLVTASGQVDPGGGPVDLFSHVHVGKLPFDQAQVLSGGNFIYAEIKTVDIYSKTVRYVYTSAIEYLNRQPLYSASTVATAILRTIQHCQPSKASFNTAIAANTVNSQYIRQAGTASGTSVTITTGSLGDNFPQNLNSSAGNVALGFSSRVSLADLMPSTICSVDRNLYFGGDTEMNLRLVFSSYTKLGCASTTITDPTANVQNLVGWTVSGLQMKVAVERNAYNIQMAKDIWRAGTNLLVPYVEEKTSNPDTALSGTLSYTFNRNRGYNLLRVHTTAFNTTNSGRTAACVENVNGALITDIRTQIDSNYLQPTKLNIADGSWYKQQYGWYKKSCLNSERMALVHWCHTDQIASGSDSTEWSKENTMDSGIPLSPSDTMLYTIEYDKSAVSAVVVSYFIFQRVLNLGPQMEPRWGISLE